ncbi:DUF4139 domain-containing protein [Amycolatopsis nigrescens]|uniref:DUF4139 domain-containing protein n=1 Tax=Amycolatopsis nigrescens TaxID=381445 RepID=UPI0003809BD6|nr:DUF4139 domain-containing protein [Amycolatopsis nigrescens]
MPTLVDLPIVAVTVYPRYARITRRGPVRLGGDLRYAVEGLPLGLLGDSVRAGGTGAAAIAGVEINTERLPRPADPAIQELMDRRRAARWRLDEVTDAETVAASKAELLATLSRRSGTSFAKALAAGTAEPDRVAVVGDALADQLARILARQRELAEQREKLTEDLSAIERALEARRVADTPDRTTVTIELAAASETPEGTEVALELSYVVTEAGWESGYDLRLRGERVSVGWYGAVTQHTGEDWPVCELALSTARPSVTTGVPELGPWFLDRVQPVRAPAPRAASGGFGGSLEMRETAAYSAASDAMQQQAADVQHGVAAATYRPARPAAIASGTVAHRSTIAEFEMDAVLDYVTAPVLAEEAHLRAVVTNNAEHTLRPGRASVFHDNEFVGSTMLESWAPGEEVELALGVDDRIRVDRELVRRTASKGTLSGTRRREAEYRIEVANHGPRPAVVTVLDQVPVSRDDAIVVRDVHGDPEPAEHTDMGELSWRLELEPEATGVVTLAFRVDVNKGVELSGWRE